jgi:hypothetical protein
MPKCVADLHPMTLWLAAEKGHIRKIQKSDGTFMYHPADLEKLDKLLAS